VIYYAKRGEFAYIWNKAKQKSNSNISQALDIEEIDPFDYFRRFSIDDYSMGDRVIDVIIPVYNGYEFLDPLFDSIERNTTTPYRLIVVNDSSPDERVKPLLLKRLESHPNSIFVDHETNLGFVKSVNEAYSYTKDHFLILNTDTEVPPYWIERLMHPILNMDRVATTTPFTNSGQIASFPNFIADNDIFEGIHKWLWGHKHPCTTTNHSRIYAVVFICSIISWVFEIYGDFIIIYSSFEYRITKVPLYDSRKKCHKSKLH